MSFGFFNPEFCVNKFSNVTIHVLLQRLLLELTCRRRAMLAAWFQGDEFIVALFGLVQQ